MTCFVCAEYLEQDLKYSLSEGYLKKYTQIMITFFHSIGG